jgi:hypothetical protein
MDNTALRRAELQSAGVLTTSAPDNNGGGGEKTPIRPRGGGATPKQSTGGFSDGFKNRALVTILGVLAIVVVLVIVIPVVISTTVTQTRESAPSSYLAANGSVICNCRDGLPGPPGLSIPGPQGIQGPEGPQGRPGDQGVPGMCIADPSCASGPTGPQGPAGPSGASGQRGYPGVDGAQGPAGPSGPSGATGPSGPSGPSGPQGEHGVNGTCDCFDLQEVTINNTVLTGSLQVLGNVSCGTQTLFESSCFPNACVNFSACDLQARRLLLTGGKSSFFISNVFANIRLL